MDALDRINRDVKVLIWMIAGQLALSVAALWLLVCIATKAGAIE